MDEPVVADRLHPDDAGTPSFIQQFDEPAISLLRLLGAVPADQDVKDLSDRQRQVRSVILDDRRYRLQQRVGFRTRRPTLDETARSAAHCRPL
jgi:hypothetical protein